MRPKGSALFGNDRLNAELKWIPLQRLIAEQKKTPLFQARSAVYLGNWILLFGKTERLYKRIPKKSI